MPGGLRLKVVLISLLPSGIILLFAGVTLFYSIEHASRQAVLQRDAEIARITAWRISEQMQSYSLPLKIIANSIAAQNMNRQAIPALIGNNLQAQHLYDGGIIVYNHEGQPVYTSKPLKDPPPQNMAPPNTHQPTFSDILIDPSLNTEIFMVMVPILTDDNRHIGTVTGRATVRYSSWESKFAHMLDLRTGRGGYAILVDGQGRVIHHRKSFLIGRDISDMQAVDLVRQGLNGSLFIDSNESDSMVCGYAPVPGSNWGIIHLEYWDLIIGDIRTQRTLILSIAPIIVVLTALILVMMIQRALRPLQKLNQATHAIAQGNFETSLEINTDDEVAELARSFNSMAAELKASYHDLEQRITELKELRGMLHNTIDSMPSIMIGIDEMFRITQWNSEAQRLTAITPDSAQGQPILETLPQLASRTEQIQRALKSQTPIHEQRVLDLLPGRVAELTIYPLSGSNGAVIRLDDVSDRIRMEEIMIQSEKMLSVGGLAAGMAHEINNPLAGILQNIQVIQNRCDPSLGPNVQKAKECSCDIRQVKCYLDLRGIPAMLQAIRDAGETAARIVENLLSFSRSSQESPSLQDMARLLDRTVELAMSDYDIKQLIQQHGILFDKHYQPNLPQVMCVPIKIQQVIINLIKNAVQSLSEIEVTPLIRLSLKSDRNNILIEIEDNGPGMDSHMQQHIFEPFFTTRKVGSGIGLGLSVAYFIITENHKGSLTVQSEPGLGTTFIISLPINSRLDSQTDQQ